MHACMLTSAWRRVTTTSPLPGREPVRSPERAEDQTGRVGSHVVTRSDRDDRPWTGLPAVGRIPSHAGHVRAIGAGGRESRVDGAVGVGSLVAVAAVAL